MEIKGFSVSEKGGKVVMKVSGRIGVSVLIVFLTIGLCYSEAWGVFDKVRAVAHIVKGDSYQEKGQWDKAIAEYNKALELNPEFAGAYINRGLAYAQGKGKSPIDVGPSKFRV